jgi:hypothetical protein
MKIRMFGINGFQIMAMALGLMTTNAFASPKTINFATGQDSNGNIQLTGNSLDANWKESNAVSPISPPNSYVVAPNNADWGNPPSGLPGWFSNGPDSSWIAPNPNDAHGNGNYTLTYTFNLAGYDLNTASFNNLQWAIDDGGSVQLNGHTEASLPTPGDSWAAFHPLSIPVSHLAQTINTLAITSIGSDTNIEAARLEGTLTISPIPEPETYAMLLAGLGLVGFITRRRKSD